MQILFLLFHLLSNNPTIHDIQVAFFKLHKLSGTVQLDINIELKDLKQVLDKPETEITADLLNEYLNQHLEFHFDNSSPRLQVHSFSRTKKHLIISAGFDKSILSFRNLDIKNTCLLSIDNHSNIVEIRLDDQERDFLMNKNRTSIHISI